MRSIAAYKDLPGECAAFSPDGSLLAISFGQVVTLWDPSSSTLVRVLTFSADTIIGAEFSGKGAFLFARSKSQVCTWNLLTCAIVHCREFGDILARISADPASSNVLIATSECAGVYSVDSVDPIHTFNAVMKSNGKYDDIIDACHGTGSIFFMDINYRITVVDLLADEEMAEVSEVCICWLIF